MSDGQDKGRSVAGLAALVVVVALMALTLPILALSLLSNQNSAAAADCSTAASATTAGAAVAGNSASITTAYVTTTSLDPNPSIVAIFREALAARDASPRVALAAFAAGLTESGIHNLASANVPSSQALTYDVITGYGAVDGIGSDGNSSGPLQQQTGADGSDTFGWGTVQQTMDPAHAITVFLDKAIPADAELAPDEDAATLAQRVQASGTADGSNYRVELDRAAQLVAGGTGARAPPAAGANPAVVDVDAEQDCADETATPVNVAAAAGAKGSFEGFPNGQLPLDRLCALSWATNQQARCDAAAAAHNLNIDYRAAFGRDICVTDSYRDYAGQVAVYADRPHLAAVPGTSNHGWAVALDLCGGIQVFSAPQHKWMTLNAPGHGWIHPDWARQGGRRPEPWHWEYVGNDATP